MYIGLTLVKYTSFKTFSHEQPFGGIDSFYTSNKILLL